MIDLLLIETFDGGDLQTTDNDLAVCDGYDTMVYLALFGGWGWWGNYLMDELDASTKYASRTEKALREVALTSAGRIQLENAVAADLEFIKKQVPGATVNVSATIVSDDRVHISINISGNEFSLQWDRGTRSPLKDRIIFTGMFSKEFTIEFT
jgi:phage gp46-like protein